MRGPSAADVLDTEQWVRAVSTSETGLVTERIEALLAEADPRTTDPVEFFGKQFDAGLASVDYPEGIGGLGVSARLQRLVVERLDAAGAQRAFLHNPLGVGMFSPTLVEHGTPDQIERFLRPAFTSEHIWCQLFSEPGAGSDLAGLSTRAVRDGDEWVINGQKVWTSLAHKAKYGMLLARTDPDLPKHQGITYFLIDMEQPGVRVRPLKQINGASEFNEVFLDDARVPDANRLGEVGAGWRVATTTLTSERAALSGGGGGKDNIGGSGIDKLVDLAFSTGRWEDPVDRARVLDLVMESALAKLTSQRHRAALRSGKSIGAEGSITKMFSGIHNRRLQRAMVDMGGANATAWAADDNDPRFAASGFLRAQANTIEGGTSNVLRGMLAERVLGMPREPGGPAKDTPWKDIPRS